MSAACRVLQNYGYYITSPFGNRTHPVTGQVQSFHKGVDIISDLRTADWIIAHTGGVVEIAKYSTTAGNYVAIRVDEHCVMRYMHMRELPLVKVGQRVEAGTVLGYMGATGTATGVHLHFDICVDGQYIDPVPYLNADYLKTDKEEKKVSYKTINDVPEWYKESVQDAINRGLIKGTGNGELNISEDICKVCVMFKRERESNT